MSANGDWPREKEDGTVRRMVIGRGKKRTGQCVSCGECCKVVRITAVLDVAIRQHGNLEELEKYQSYRGIRVMGVNRKRNHIYYETDIVCSQLTTENKCTVYGKPDQRPLICEKYPWFQDNIETCGYRYE